VHRHPRRAGREVEPLHEDGRDTGPSAQRPRERRDLAAAVAGQLDVVREQRLEPGEIPLLGGCEEPAGQLVALLARRLEARPALLDVPPGAGRELACVVASVFTGAPVRPYAPKPATPCATNRRTPTAWPAESRLSVPSVRRRLVGSAARSVKRWTPVSDVS
jgi:hypothetical protein